MANTYINDSDPVLASAGVPVVVVSGAAPTVGQAIVATGATTAVWSTVTSGGGTVLTGDVTGTAGSNTVISITGATGHVNVAATGNVITWAAATTAPGLGQASESTATKGADLTLTPQVSTHATDNGGGNFVVALQVPHGAGLETDLLVTRGGTISAAIGPYGPTQGYGALYSAIWLGPNITPSGSNASFLGDGTSVVQLSIPNNGSINLCVGNNGGVGVQMLTSGSTATSFGPSANDVTSSGTAALAWTGIYGYQMTLGGTVLNDVTATAVTTTNATLTTLYTSAVASSSMNDYVVSVWGLDHTNGDVYRADFSFTYQRISTAGPTAVGATPVPLNVRGTTNGLTWGGASVAVSSNNILVKVQGISSINVDWKCSVSVATVT